MGLLKFTADSFQNFAARVGLGAGSQHDQSTYSPNYLSRNRIRLESMYRSSWVVGQAVDVVADDMTREGINMRGLDAPEDGEEIQQELDRLQVWGKLNKTIKWSRLYGGAIAVMLIDGQNVSTPLNIKTIGKDQFKGLLVLDRWMVTPTLNDLVTDYGPDYGMPRFYDVITDSVGLCNQRVHYSRVVRMDGVELPYWQAIAENLWGQSVIERLEDRLTIFDSATLGAGQLVYKAHLRTYKVKGLRSIIAAGGKLYDALVKQIEQIRMWQSNEGMTLMDAEDTFETHQYSFSGLDDLLIQFGQQISGALGIPLVRLFGQSPAGMNATGESDLSNYYDNINQQQEGRLRTPLQTLIEVVSLSKLGKSLPESFKFDFASLWQIDEKVKAEVANTIVQAVTTAEENGLISKSTALKELRQSSEVTGVFSHISDEEIENADDDPPAPRSELEDEEPNQPTDTAPGAENGDKVQSAA
ncbi:DUF1073 domain-containing protein [Acinetobacter soli]|uniref:DUF1073 domain-containing protein n=1 Tax=Acinetobacter soli TaxID=487316 RepID=UPI00280E5E89|nr:DUF1073 domain-containing protein [Acinetobacter soli]MDQ8996361.1 DUF1073 domain-containing protein [Acinetobacter soli]